MRKRLYNAKRTEKEASKRREAFCPPPGRRRRLSFVRTMRLLHLGKAASRRSGKHMAERYRQRVRYIITRIRPANKERG